MLDAEKESVSILRVLHDNDTVSNKLQRYAKGYHVTTIQYQQNLKEIISLSIKPKKNAEGCHVI